MFKYITILTLGLLMTKATAKPFSTVGHTSQLDVRNNYNSASGYATSIGYALPSRIVASAPSLAYSAPLAARYTPYVLGAGTFAYGSPSLARYESPLVGAGYGSPYVTGTGPFAAPYVQQISPFAPNFASPYSAAFGTQAYTP